jgi:hypothetical protein
VEIQLVQTTKILMICYLWIRIFYSVLYFFFFFLVELGFELRVSWFLPRQVLYHLSHMYGPILFYFGGTGIWTQGLALGRQVIYHLSHARSTNNNILKSVFYLKIKQLPYMVNLIVVGHQDHFHFVLQGYFRRYVCFPFVLLSTA